MSRLCRLKSYQNIGDDGVWAYGEIVSLRRQLAEKDAEIELANATKGPWRKIAEENLQGMAICRQQLAEYQNRVLELEERRCEVCGYAEHHREHTGCLRTLLAESQARIAELEKELAKWK